MINKLLTVLKRMCFLNGIGFRFKKEYQLIEIEIKYHKKSLLTNKQHHEHGYRSKINAWLLTFHTSCLERKTGNHSLKGETGAEKMFLFKLF